MRTTLRPPRCPVCRDYGVIVGSLPHLPTSAPLQLLPCPRRCQKKPGPKGNRRKG